VKTSEYIMENIVSIDFLDWTCKRHVESLLIYYKCKYMTIVNAQQRKYPVSTGTCLLVIRKLGWPWYDWMEFISTGLSGSLCSDITKEYHVV
jgi:hypothetical protein